MQTTSFQILCFTVGTFLAVGCTSPQPAHDLSDFELALRSIDAQLDALPGSDESYEGWLQRAVLRFRKASLTNSYADFESAKIAIEKAKTEQVEDDLKVLEAQLEFKLHQDQAAKSILENVRYGEGSALLQSMLGDLELQAGRFDVAQAEYAQALETERTWYVLARLAHLRLTLGDIHGAEQYYIEAQDEITAKNMRAYAWVEVQRGELDFDQGVYDEAMRHYRRADRAFSGYWLVRAHIAEVLAAQERLQEAVEVYLRICDRNPSPEIFEAIGTVYASLGDKEQSRSWHQKALSSYLQAASRGEVRYLHHLASYYSDVEQNGPEAVKWAQRDFALRPGLATRQALAWALYVDGQHGPAREEILQVLDSGMSTAHLFAQAASILASANDQASVMALRKSSYSPSATHRHVHH